MRKRKLANKQKKKEKEEKKPSKTVDAFSSQEDEAVSPPEVVRPSLETITQVEVPPEQQEHRKSLLTNVILLGIFALVINVGCTINESYRRTRLNQQLESNPPQFKAGLFSIFEESMASLREAFPNQDRTTWSSLKIQGKRLFEQTASQPSCVLFLYTEETRPVTECLVSAYANALRQLLGFKTDQDVVKVKTADLKSNHEEARGVLFNRMRIKLNREKVILLNDIGDLDAEAAMALHGICDEAFRLPSTEKNYPMLLMTLRVSRLDDTSTNAYQIASDELKKSWLQDLGMDVTQPLISRVARVPVNIKHDDHDDSVCDQN